MMAGKSIGDEISEMLISGHEDHIRQNIKDAELLSKRRRFIYFIKSESGHIKIGSAFDVKARLLKVQVDCPFKTKLLGKMKHGEFTEIQIQRMFKRYKYHGEWFIESDEIIDFIKTHKIGRRRG